MIPDPAWVKDVVLFLGRLYHHADQFPLLDLVLGHDLD
jgi:hypothetical protein